MSAIKVSKILNHQRINDCSVQDEMILRYVMINQVWTIEKFLIKKAIKSAVGTTSTYITNPLSFRWKTRNPVSFPCPGRGHTCFARPLPELPACQIRQYTDIKWAACLNLFRSNVVMFRGNLSISLMISKRKMDWIQFLNFVLQPENLHVNPDFLAFGWNWV